MSLEIETKNTYAIRGMVELHGITAVMAVAHSEDGAGLVGSESGV